MDTLLLVRKNLGDMSVHPSKVKLQQTICSAFETILPLLKGGATRKCFKNGKLYSHPASQLYNKDVVWLSMKPTSEGMELWFVHPFINKLDLACGWCGKQIGNEDSTWLDFVRLVDGKNGVINIRFKIENKIEFLLPMLVVTCSTECAKNMI